MNHFGMSPERFRSAPEKELAPARTPTLPTVNPPKPAFLTANTLPTPASTSGQWVADVQKPVPSFWPCDAQTSVPPPVPSQMVGQPSMPISLPTSAHISTKLTSMTQIFVQPHSSFPGSEIPSKIYPTFVPPTVAGTLDGEQPFVPMTATPQIAPPTAILPPEIMPQKSEKPIMTASDLPLPTTADVNDTIFRSDPEVMLDNRRPPPTRRNFRSPSGSPSSRRYRIRSRSTSRHRYRSRSPSPYRHRNRSRSPSPSFHRYRPRSRSRSRSSPRRDFEFERDRYHRSHERESNRRSRSFSKDVVPPKKEDIWTEPKACIYCGNEGHLIQNCVTFLRFNMEERWKEIFRMSKRPW